MQYPFDYKKAEFVLKSYALSTGIACSLIDEEGNTILDIDDDYSIYKNLKLHDPGLKESFLYGANQAFVYGGSYIFFGPFGFVHFTTPIIRNQIIAGAFVVGPILMTQRDEFLYDLVISHAQNGKENRSKIINFLDKIPLISTTKVKALSDLLLSSVYFVSEEGYDRFEQDQIQMAQGSKSIST